MKIGWLWLLILLLLPLYALGEQAADVTAQCRIDVEGTHGILPFLTDRDEKTSMTEYGFYEYHINVHPGDTPIAAVYLEFGTHYLPFRVEKNTGSGWETVAEYADATYPQAHMTFPAQQGAFRLTFYQSSLRKNLSLRELYLFSEGELGDDYAHAWQPAPEQADFLVVVAHPDDEWLWFGGAIPTYAVERGISTQVAYLTRSEYAFHRTHELLNGLWHCGVRCYPEIGSFEDHYTFDMGEAYSVMGINTVKKHMVRLLRRYQPEVVLTHDVKGEYGHGQHQACANSMIQAVTLAADPNYDPQSMREYGVWQVKKLYVHLGEQPTTTLDWRQPLSAFGGKTGFELAKEAFKYHITQDSGHFQVAEEGSEYDSTKYTLIFSTVGEDTAGNDFFEHISLD